MARPFEGGERAGVRWPGGLTTRSGSEPGAIRSTTCSPSAVETRRCSRCRRCARRPRAAHARPCWIEIVMGAGAAGRARR